MAPVNQHLEVAPLKPSVDECESSERRLTRKRLTLGAVALTMFVAVVGTVELTTSTTLQAADSSVLQSLDVPSFHLAGDRKERALLGLPSFDSLLKKILPDPVINAVDVVSGSTKTLTVKVPTTMKSTLPFPVSLFGKDLKFDVVYKNGIVVGEGVLPKFTLKPGTFDVDAIVKMTPKGDAQVSAVNEVLERHSNGLATNITMANFRPDPPIPLIGKVFGILKMNSAMPGLHEKLIKKVGMAIHLAELPKVKTIVEMYNPFDVAITITYLKSTVSAEGKDIGSIDQATSIVLPPKVVTPSAPLDAIAIIGPDTIALIGKLQSGAVKLNVVSTMTLAIESFPAQIAYNQNEVDVAVTMG